MPNLLFFIMLSISVSLANGCSAKDLELIVRYNHLEGLETGNRVVLEDTVIGRVGHIRQDNAGLHLVTILIMPEFSKSANAHTHFFITTDPVDKSKKAVGLAQTQTNGRQLASGETVSGVSEIEVWMERLKAGSQKGAQELSQEWSQLMERLRRLPESDTARQLEKDLEQMARTLKDKGQDLKQRFEKNVLPTLKKELEHFQRQLEEAQPDNAPTPNETRFQKPNTV